MENISGLLEYKGEDVEFLISNDGLGFWQISFEGVDVGDNSVLQELHYIFGKIEITGELEEVKDAWAEIFESEGISFTFYGGQDHRNTQTLFEKKNRLIRWISNKTSSGIGKANKKAKEKNDKIQKKKAGDDFKKNLGKINQLIKNGDLKIVIKPLTGFFHQPYRVFITGNMKKEKKDLEQKFKTLAEDIGTFSGRAILVLKRDGKKISFTKIKGKMKDSFNCYSVEKTFEKDGLATKTQKEFNKYFGSVVNDDNYKKQFVKIVGDEDVDIWLSKGKGAVEDLDYFIDNNVPGMFNVRGLNKQTQTDISGILGKFSKMEVKLTPPLLKK